MERLAFVAALRWRRVGPASRRLGSDPARRRRVSRPCCRRPNSRCTSASNWPGCPVGSTSGVPVVASTGIRRSGRRRCPTAGRRRDSVRGMESSAMRSGGRRRATCRLRPEARAHRIAWIENQAEARPAVLETDRQRMVPARQMDLAGADRDPAQVPRSSGHRRVGAAEGAQSR